MKVLKNQNVLITGALGFVGANLVRKLYRNNSVHIFAKKTSDDWRIRDISQKLHFHYVDLQDEKSVSQVCKKIQPEYIFHLATRGAYSQQKDPLDILKTNLLGTANLITALNPIPYKALINTGSSSEYGFKKHPMFEADVVEPNSFYAVSKVAAAFLSRVFAQSNHKPIVTLRLFSVYGPFEEPGRLIPTLILCLLNKQKIYLAPNKTRRDFIYVDDVVDAFIHTAISMSEKLYGEICNIGTGQQFTSEEVTHSIAQLLNTKATIDYTKFKNRSWDTDFWVANMQKTRSVLGWESQYSLEQGLQKTVKWFQKYGKNFPNYVEKNAI
ncbi:NAD-dependent epimerase/dehydratase family protein [Candidatus Microgenomates bacterium]|nr:MAG: NAD-dependent epimerase/dehydratase family protein [Candidatus Microgenomates bacterium]